MTKGNGKAKQLTSRTGPKDIKHREITWQAREKIKCTQIINRLHRHIFAKTDKALMNDAQVKASLGLLKKVIPDLSASHIHRTQAEGFDPRTTEDIKLYIGEIFGQIIDITPNPEPLPALERSEPEPEPRSSSSPSKATINYMRD